MIWPVSDCPCGIYKSKTSLTSHKITNSEPSRTKFSLAAFLGALMVIRGTGHNNDLAVYGPTAANGVTVSFPELRLLIEIEVSYLPR